VNEPADASSACALCGRPGAPIYRELGDRLFDVPGSWSLLACTGCGLVFLHPMPERDRIGDLYERYYTHDADPADEVEATDDLQASWLRRTVNRGIPSARLGYPELPATDPLERGLAWLLSLAAPLREIAERGVMWLPPRKGRLLDVGCGSGVFLARMRDFGWQVAGVEPDPRARKAAARRLGGDVPVAAGLDDGLLAGGGFDAVTLAHVIEHVPDPLATLRACAGLLRPGGTLVCVTPNTRSLGARSFGASWLHWDPPRHLHLFAPGLLADTVGRAGLAVQRVSTPASTAHFVWRASALIERQGRLPGARTAGASPALWLESLGFLAVELALTRLGRRCGEEVLVVAEKPAEAATA
jgi:2-polyprenyl-3-methyl-5-hydroxy-6-metoxy-1,4-benzoquinol methylase